MMTNISNLSPYSYNGIASGGASGKLYVPVNPANVIYAQFDHISGVAAKKGQHGVFNYKNPDFKYSYRKSCKN